MAKQWIEIFEHDARGVVVGDETMLALPVLGSLKPKFAPVDEPREEYRGADTGQGDVSVRRKESQWTHTLECYWYPIAAVGLLLKHALGFADERATVDTSAARGIVLPQNMPYGSGSVLGDSAIGIRVNYDKGDGTTVSKIYYGGRIGKMSVSAEGSDEVKLSFDLSAPGQYISAEAAATAEPDFSGLPAPFNAGDVRLYTGAGISRTGSAPEYTAIAPGAMVAFVPDSWSLEIDSGRQDKAVANGVRGPSKTVKESKLAVSFKAPLDIEDPASGFSCRDEIEAQFSGPREMPILIVLDNGELAGAATATYQAAIDLPRLKLAAWEETYNTTGKQPTTNMDGSHLFSTVTGYGLAIVTTDQVAAY